MVNKTEKRAMKIVMNYEKKRGKNPKDVSRKKCGYDIKSGNRYIEVKGKSQGDNPPQWINFYKKLLIKLGKNIKNYYVYIVYNLPNKKSKGKPKLLIFPPEVVLSNLEIDTNFIFFPKKVLKKHNKIKPINT